MSYFLTDFFISPNNRILFCFPFFISTIVFLYSLINIRTKNINQTMNKYFAFGYKFVRPIIIKSIGPFIIITDNANLFTFLSYYKFNLNTNITFNSQKRRLYLIVLARLDSLGWNSVLNNLLQIYHKLLELGFLENIACLGKK